MGRIVTGDVVSLRSGGPEMMVDTQLMGVRALKNQIAVVWMDARGQVRRDVFPSSALRILPAKEDV